MPNSPNVRFNFENNNVEQSTPLMGVSCILTTTSKGPVEDPETVITSIAQFQRVFGKELIPMQFEGGDDNFNSVSNVEKALKGGSKLRIVRVVPESYTKGKISCGSDENVSNFFQSTVNGIVYNTNLEPKVFEMVQKASDESSVTTYTLTLTDTYYANKSHKISYTLKDSNGSTLSTGVWLTYQYAKDNVDGINHFDYQSLAEAVENISDYLKVSKPSVFENFITALQEADGTDQEADIEFSEHSNADSNKTVTTSDYVITPNIYQFSDITSGDFVRAMDSVKDYVDMYNIAVSNLSGFFGTTAATLGAIHRELFEKIKDLEEYRYFIEVPYNIGRAEDDTWSKDDITNWIDTVMTLVGNSKYVSYFGGGLRYYNEYGRLIDSEVLGTVLGLADASASNYGPWRSFSGSNRGLVLDAKGPVLPNYGAPSRYEDLNDLANHYMNLMVIKDTYTMGKQTMLWHGFTSQIKQDSEKFISIVGLNLYLKKTLRPLYESYLEEPNIWTTWRAIWNIAKTEILDPLIDNDAITEYTYMGDQDATSYDQLEVNNEADVRQGKYKVILKYKDIVPMQEVTVNIVIDAASKSVSISEEA